MSTFSWPPVPPASTTSESSDGLSTTGAPVNVSDAAPPVAGQVLTATDSEHAGWRVPGLKYDAAIRFNVNAGGSATIEPGTWGFVYTAPVAATEITIFVVSSLSAPPVDSRFGLYVSPSQTLPITVSLIGASQIMGLDGTLSTSVGLQPGAMYEWVFYHEGGAAIWGLVSETTRTVDAVDRLSSGIAGATHVDLVADSNVNVLSATTVDGVAVSGKRVLLTAQTTTSQNGTWTISGSEWNKQADGLQPTLDQFVIVDNGSTQAGEIWVRWDTEEYVPISVGAPLTAGTGITRTGNAFSLAAHASTHARGGSDLVAASQLSESAGPTTLSIGAVSDNQYLRRSGATLVGVSTALPTNHASSMHGRGGTDVVIASRISESSGPTNLDIASIASGQYLQRSGTNIIGVTPSTPPEVKMMTANVTGAGEKDLTNLGFDVAANESVVIEWYISSKHGDASFASDDTWSLKTGVPTGTVPMTRIAMHAEWRRGPTPLFTINNTIVGPLNTTLHTIFNANTSIPGLTGQLVIHLGITNGSSAITIRPYLQYGTAPATIYAGSWGRCTRGVTVG